MPEIANLQVVVGADTSAAERGLDSLGQKVGGVGSAIQSALGAAAVGAVAGLGAAFVGSVKSAADFEKQMSAVGAVAGASQAEMEQLTKAALQLGKDTSFSATEAAQGLEELVKAGVSVEDILGGGAKAALDLAAAGAVSVADAAEIASNAMNVFGLAGSDMAHVADLIAGAANASAISVTDYKFSLSAAGAVAATVGISFESLTEAIAIMGNAGIKGSDAGTSLKTMMMNLVPATNKASDMMRELGIITGDANPAMEELRQHLSKTEAGQKKLAQMMKSGLINSAEDLFKAVKKLNPEVLDGTQNFNEFAMMGGHLGNQFFDAEGKAKSFAEISEVLKNALHGMSEEQKIATLRVLFGSDAIRAAAIMAEAGAEGFEQMAEAMGKVTAAQVAEERLNNLWGSIEKLQGSLETAAIMLGGLFTPALKAMADATTEYVNQAIEIIEQLPDAWRTFVQAFEGGWEPSETLSPFINLVGQAGKALRENFGPAILAAGKFITGTLIPGLKAIIAPIAAFSAGFLGAVAAAGAVAAILGVVAGVLGFLLSPLGLVAIAVGALAAAWVTNFGGIQEKTAALWAYLQPIFQQWWDWLSVKLAQAVTWLSETGWPMLVEAATAVWAWINDSLLPTLAALWDWLSPKLAAALSWLAETGWPLLVEAASAVWTFVQESLIPTLSELWDWLSPKLQAATTWITETGWPALVTAGEKVWEMVQTVIQFFKDLYVELDKRGVFTELGTIWDTLVSIGGKVWDILVKLAEALAPVFKWVSDLIQQATGIPALVDVMGFLADKSGVAAPTVQKVADAIAAVMKIISNELQRLEKFIDLLGSLGSIKLPSWFGGGGGSGATQLSFSGGSRASEHMARINAASLATGVPADVIAAIMDTEGSGNYATSPAGATGPMQVMPFHARPGEDLRDLDTNVLAGARVMAENFQRYGNWESAAAAYFGAVDAAGRPTTASDVGGMTGINYVRRFNQERQKYQNSSTPLNQMQRMPLGMSFPGGMPGSDPSHWPMLIQDVIDVAPDWQTAMAQISEHGQMAFLDIKEAGTAAGADLVTTSTDDLGNVTTIYSRAGVTIGATLTDAAGNIINTWGEIAVSGAEAGRTLVSTSTDAMGNVTSIYTDAAGQMTAVITDASGQVINTFGGAAAEVTAAAEEMRGQTLSSVTQLGDGLLTTMQTSAGSTIATVTDMSGQVTSQYATLANGVQITMGDMANGVLTSQTDLGDGIMTIVQDAAGNYIATITDLAGNVVNQYVTMADGSSEAITGLAQESREQFGNVVRAAESVREPIGNVSDALGDIRPPDTGGVVSAFRSIRSAASDATEEVRDLLDSIKDITKASKGGGKAPWAAKAAGGPVSMGSTYLVGEAGPELFVPNASGYIVPNHMLGRGGGDEVHVNVNVYGNALASRRDIADAVVAGLLEAQRTNRTRMKVV